MFLRLNQQVGRAVIWQVCSREDKCSHLQDKAEPHKGTHVEGGLVYGEVCLSGDVR